MLCLLYNVQIYSGSNKLMIRTMGIMGIMGRMWISHVDIKVGWNSAFKRHVYIDLFLCTLNSISRISRGSLRICVIEKILVFAIVFSQN